MNFFHLFKEWIFDVEVSIINLLVANVIFLSRINQIIQRILVSIIIFSLLTPQSLTHWFTFSDLLTHYWLTDAPTNSLSKYLWRDWLDCACRLRTGVSWLINKDRARRGVYKPGPFWRAWCPHHSGLNIAPKQLHFIYREWARKNDSEVRRGIAIHNLTNLWFKKISSGILMFVLLKRWQLCVVTSANLLDL